MTTPFVHLHVHSDYSLLDGAAKCSSLVDRCAEMGMSALAITDHGNMGACFDLLELCEKKDIKPIYGCEFYVAPIDYQNRLTSVPHNRGYHLVCLAETYEGYINMCHLNEEAWLKGFHYNPRIDKELLRKYHKGIIGLSACLGGEVASHILEGQIEAASKAIDEYVEIFGEGNFFLELQDHGLEEDKTVLPQLKAFAKEKNLPLVCTNDSHYVDKEDAEAHELFLCIGTQKKLSDPERFKMPGGPVYYFKSPDEMAELFADTPEALENTVKIAERCNVKMPRTKDGANHYPAYPLPPDFQGTREEYLRQLCNKGMKERYGIDMDADEFTDSQKVYIDRMNYELGIIARMGFTSYYLVVWDFLNWGHEHNVPLGPGRGSGAGSIVAYLIHITDIDPIRYNLLFERFLNPDRVSPPDFDIDLCERRRHLVIEYVREKYGEGNVVQIGTYGTLKAKAVVKDVARALGRTFEEGNRIARLIPADPKMTLAKARTDCAELNQMIENEPWVQELWKYAVKLEGMNRNMSMHAAGVIICDTRVSNVCPISKGADDEPTTQFPAHPDEELGLLKMDFLGLRNLTIIQDALDLIEKNTGHHLKSSEIPEGDQNAYALLTRGETIGVFQLESPGMQDLCRKFGVSRLEDIIALIALYRPGPLQFKDEFVGRKNGSIPVIYETPVIEPILKETYGIMLYQEQVMQVAQVFAGFSLGEADLLRRAMGKKKPEVMLAMYSKFEEGALAKGHSKELIKTLWEKMVEFAKYGFNKSHSAAYGLLAYQTAYLKANYPAEFMSAILTSELGNAEKMIFFLKECHRMGIRILPPDVNICDAQFSVDGKNIRFGLAAISGIGESQVSTIVAAREKGGDFKSLDDFCQRVEGLNRKMLESLIKAGAMDCFGLRRAQMMAMCEQAIGLAQQKQKDSQSGQLSLFDMLDEQGDGNSFNSTAVPDIPEWPQNELLQYEKELLGFYISGHPIQELEWLIKSYQSHDLADIPNLPHNTSVRVAGFISGTEIKTTRKDNSTFIILTLENDKLHLECTIFPDDYQRAIAKNPTIFEKGRIIFVDGEVSCKEKDTPVRLIGRKIYTGEEIPSLFTRALIVHLSEETFTEELLDKFMELCTYHSGNVPLKVMVHCRNGRIAGMEGDGLAISEDLCSSLTELLGAENVTLRTDRTPSERPKMKWKKQFNNA